MTSRHELEVCQVCWAVPNLDAALPVFESLFGPAEVLDVTLTDVEYRGRRVTTDLRIAKTTSKALELELIEQCGGEGPFGVPEGSPWVFNHLKLVVPDFDVAMAALGEDGHTVVYEGTAGPVTFAFVESPELGPAMLELTKRES